MIVEDHIANYVGAQRIICEAFFFLSTQSPVAKEEGRCEKSYERADMI